jgi:hypothetical protein
MTVLLKLLYAASIAALIVLAVAFGVRTFYPPPEEPEFPRATPDLFRPVPPSPTQPTPTLTPAQQEFEEAQIRYQEEYDDYREELEDYHAVVFAVAALLGVAAVAGGVALSSRLDALRLGLVGGGLGTLVYGVIQAEGDLDSIGAAAVFVIVALGLVLVLAAGYRWLSPSEA